MGSARVWAPACLRGSRHCRSGFCVKCIGGCGWRNVRARGDGIADDGRGAHTYACNNMLPHQRLSQRTERDARSCDSDRLDWPTHLTHRSALKKANRRSRPHSKPSAQHTPRRSRPGRRRHHVRRQSAICSLCSSSDAAELALVHVLATCCCSRYDVTRLGGSSGLNCTGSSSGSGSSPFCFRVWFSCTHSRANLSLRRC